MPITDINSPIATCYLTRSPLFEVITPNLPTTGS